ncbi:DUF1624 domain-containing protein [Agarilytica rhodophyticola]|uniref:DUF1624 domain-containing protein n=1 Tax=Agarilytica rhodophyticola TaxID=1737490 RepID=UPI000B3468D2|nr:heparan-alpha-glucosaminide N-acetyltransferase domain-containing protein [Agarilytica rhodophyticola]
MQTSTARLHHIDLLRGLIIIFMIVDHAMVYCSSYHVNDPMDIPGTEPKIFFSRLLSHFCAPLFIFLAGLSSALTESRAENGRQFATSLIQRGFVLILLEFTLISWSWSFNPLYPMLYAQVIWAIGWGFVCLGILRLVDVKLVFIVGLMIVFGHNLLDSINFESNTWQHYLWSVLHQKNVLTLPFDFKIRTTYPVLPVIGLMCLGYIAGRYYIRQNFSNKTERQALLVGITCLLCYFVLRGFNIYGDTGQFALKDSALLTLMAFFNPTKYPLSLQFMLLTVGTGLIALFFFKHSKPKFSEKFLQTLGKTSMFSYILHLYLLHFLSWLLIPVLGFKFSDMTYGETLIGLPKGFGLSYGATYLLVICVVILTVLLANIYLPWKRANKTNLIAKYV